MTENTNLSTVIISSSKGEGKSAYETLLIQQGASFISSATRTDGEVDFEQAERAAHNIDEALPIFHDTVFDATGLHLDNQELRQVLAKLPEDLKDDIEQFGLADTEVRETIFQYLQAIKFESKFDFT